MPTLSFASLPGIDFPLYTPTPISEVDRRSNAYLRLNLVSGVAEYVICSLGRGERYLPKYYVENRSWSVSTSLHISDLVELASDLSPLLQAYLDDPERCDDLSHDIEAMILNIDDSAEVRAVDALEFAEAHNDLDDRLGPTVSGKTDNQIHITVADYISDCESNTNCRLMDGDVLAAELIRRREAMAA